MYRELDSRTAVAGQIGAGDMAELAAEGFTAVVNNRPDGEEAGQPASAALAEAAAAAGLAYHHIPIAGGFAAADVAAMRAVLEEDGRLLAFCRSGTRSTFLWAIAEARRGRPKAEIIAAAEQAGYDLSPVGLYLDQSAG